MFKKFLKFFTALSIALYSFSNLAIEIPACDTSECKSHFKEYKKYSKAGYADAMATLGDFYLKGHGTDKNLKKALNHYQSNNNHKIFQWHWLTFQIIQESRNYLPNGPYK